MATITGGWLSALYLYDVAESIDLDAVGALVSATAAAPMAAKAPAPPYIQYARTPVAIEGSAIDSPQLGAWQVRCKLFDYGVISIALTHPMPPSWDDLLAAGLRWHEDPELPAATEQLCRRLMDRLSPALHRPRADLLSEDYLVAVVTSAPGMEGADAVVATQGAMIAQLLRGEREPLSAQERDEVLRHRLSYLASDLVVPAWNAAFVFDTEAGARGTLEILEFANSQLLEFRYYDRLLDAELARIYPRLQRPGWAHSWFGRRFTRAARQVHSVFIEVNELTDKTENALKIAGDVYVARLFTLVAARLGLDHWKGNVREKLKTVDDIYRFTVEQTAMARGELLELAIVLILILELILFFAGIMR